MAMKILTRLTFSEARSEVGTPDGIAEVKPYQIIVMVSITARNVIDFDPGVPRIPAILDTGYNHNLAIRREQLDRWVKLRESERGQIRVGDVRLPLIPANVWIHPNRPGTREVAGHPPFKLEVKEGIAVYAPEVTNPARLPTLGLRVLVRNGLKLVIDGKRREVTLKTSGWFSPVTGQVDRLDGNDVWRRQCAARHGIHAFIDPRDLPRIRAWADGMLSRKRDHTIRPRIGS